MLAIGTRKKKIEKKEEEDEEERLERMATSEKG